MFYQCLQGPGGCTEASNKYVVRCQASSEGKSRGNQGFDIFDKKVLLIQIHGDLHWSLFGIFNHRHIADRVGGHAHDHEQPMPLMLHLDPLSNSHDTNAISRRLRGWLNYEWGRRPKSEEVSRAPKPFSKRTMKVICPCEGDNRIGEFRTGLTCREPHADQTFVFRSDARQDNTFDCGVFTCRYMLAFYRLGASPFTWRGMGQGDAGRIKCFLRDSGEFDFGPKDVARTRIDTQALFRRLASGFRSNLLKTENSKRT
jgi:Ulp1 family protease